MVKKWLSVVGCWLLVPIFGRSSHWRRQNYNTDNQQLTTNNFFKFVPLVFCFLFLFSFPAHAEWAVIDSLSLAPFIPIVLDAFMSVSMASYAFFVGAGNGPIYMLVWGWLIIYIVLYVFKLYFPGKWMEFFNFSGGGQMYKGIGGFEIGENILKPILRAFIAAIVFLQVKPTYITKYVIDPFLQFGAIYTTSISDHVTQISGFGVAPEAKCPGDVQNYMSAESCKFLVQPVTSITHVNNQVIKRGADLVSRGFAGLMTLIPNGGEDILNLITGLILIFAFVSSNFFLAILIIQGIFDFGMALILYPFKVLTFVVKGDNKKWIDPWVPLGGLVDALKKLVITMIASIFILSINVAIVRALFNWNKAVFVAAAGGSAYSNAAITTTPASGIGEHVMMWLSAILTFIMMYKIFDITKKQLEKYTGTGGKDQWMYDKFKTHTKNIKERTTKYGQGIAKNWNKYMGKK
jgi:hypothetical protein